MTSAMKRPGPGSTLLGAVMSAYHWPPGRARRVKLQRFVERFFNQFERLLAPPFHPKWQEVGLREDLPGWQRLATAAELLANR